MHIPCIIADWQQTVEVRSCLHNTTTRATITCVEMLACHRMQISMFVHQVVVCELRPEHHAHSLKHYRWLAPRLPPVQC